MRRGGRILIILGLFLGLLAAVGAFAVMNQQTATTQSIPTKPVVISLQPIPPRTEIKAEAVGKIDWPEPVPPGSFEKTEDVIGKLSLQQLYPGQIFLSQSIVDKSKLKEVGSNAALLVPEGKIAVSFGFDNVAGAAQAGDYVDMMMTLSTAPPPTTTTTAKTTPTGNEGLAMTQMFLQNILILQVGPWPASGTAQQNSGGGGVLTFALDRQDALTVKSAQEQGSIQLILRRTGDSKIATTEPVNLQYLNKRFNFNLTPSSTK